MDILTTTPKRLLLCAAALAFAGVALPQQASAANSATDESCRFEQLSITTDFDMGRLDGCEKTGEHAYRIHLKPENEPINPSPWYAFRVEPTADLKPNQEVWFTLVSHNGPARYQPKISFDKHRWAPVKFATNDNRMSFSVNLKPERPLYIAGQEIIDEEVYRNWLTSLPQNDNQEVFTLGLSTEQRPLRAYQHYAGEGKPWFVMIGRQHPPEVTGAFAFIHFGTTVMLGKSDELVALREQFNILMVPLMNPDGVARGNWRHTSTGVDLNRDWRNLAEPESQHLHAFMQEKEAAGEEVFFALDFHSTHYNIYYTMPADYKLADGRGLEHPQLVKNWLAELSEAIAWEVKEKPGHNPESGVFKQYMADTYARHSVTYEVGDTTDRREIQTTAVEAARTLAQTLLNAKNSAPQ